MRGQDLQQETGQDQKDQKVSEKTEDNKSSFSQKIQTSVYALLSHCCCRRSSPLVATGNNQDSSCSIKFKLVQTRLNLLMILAGQISQISDERGSEWWRTIIWTTKILKV